MADLADRMAKLIRVTRHGSHVLLEIDGKEFPWLIATEGVTVQPSVPNSIPTVSVAIIADRVEVDDSLIPVDGCETCRYLRAERAARAKELAGRVAKEMAKDIAQPAAS